MPVLQALSTSSNCGGLPYLGLGRLEKSIASDPVRFIVGYEGEEFVVHAGIVAQLSVPLRNLLNDIRDESGKRHVAWEDVDKDIFLRFIQFAYTGVFEGFSPIQKDVSSSNAVDENEARAEADMLEESPNVAMLNDRQYGLTYQGERKNNLLTSTIPPCGGFGGGFGGGLFGQLASKLSQWSPLPSAFVLDFGGLVRYVYTSSGTESHRLRQLIAAFAASPRRTANGGIRGGDTIPSSALSSSKIITFGVDDALAAQYEQYVNELNDFIVSKSGKQVRIWGTFPPSTGSNVTRDVSIQDWANFEAYTKSDWLSNSYNVLNSDDDVVYIVSKWSTLYLQQLNLTFIFHGSPDGSAFAPNIFDPQNDTENVPRDHPAIQGHVSPLWTDWGPNSTTALETYYSWRDGLPALADKQWGGTLARTKSKDKVIVNYDFSSVGCNRTANDLRQWVPHEGDLMPCLRPGRPPRAGLQGHHYPDRAVPPGGEVQGKVKEQAVQQDAVHHSSEPNRVRTQGRKQDFLEERDFRDTSVVDRECGKASSTQNKRGEGARRRPRIERSTYLSQKERSAAE
ncbi:hypothetical protein B0T11DRAFT_298902 [Plectosphaerella cucumerina]|uniref:BTB domain-containing protein n=1 Tax=Plectosphaerella cucumerina TaxID=40658 RepID=A0A8K0X0I1_9PEZI|nr:hypothetical protein B0T11DRAFT_298902 [Plectosphaerella cucumerina]